MTNDNCILSTGKFLKYEILNHIYIIYKYII